MIKVLFYIPLFVGLLVVPTQSWADFEAGQDAFKRGDYATALKELRPLAEAGLAMAQNSLGLMYMVGLGVPEDYAERRGKGK